MRIKKVILLASLLLALSSVLRMPKRASWKAV